MVFGVVVAGFMLFPRREALLTCSGQAHCVLANPEKKKSVIKHDSQFRAWVHSKVVP